MNDSPTEERRHRERSPFRNIWWGAALILVGIAFLPRNMNIVSFDNEWWALFILIPVGGAFITAWQRYQQAGQITAQVVGSCVGGCVLLFVTAMFFFHLNWSVLWPVFLILGGLGALLSSMVARR
jgi:hypothetical protein